MKVFTLKLTQFDYFRNGGGCRIRKRGDIRTDVKDRGRNPFGVVLGDDVSVRFDGDIYPATIKYIYIDCTDASDASKRWVAVIIAPKKAGQ